MERDLLEKIKYWCEIVNKEIGREDCTEKSIAFFTNLIPIADFTITNNWYLVTIVSNDMWGDECLSVVSYYIKKDVRNNPRYMLEIQRKIDEIAKREKVRYIYQGSHINKKLNSFLIKRGYEPQTFYKEIK